MALCSSSVQHCVVCLRLICNQTQKCVTIKIFLCCTSINTKKNKGVPVPQKEWPCFSFNGDCNPYPLRWATFWVHWDANLRRERGSLKKVCLIHCFLRALAYSLFLLLPLTSTCSNNRVGKYHTTGIDTVKIKVKKCKCLYCL